MRYPLLLTRASSLLLAAWFVCLPLVGKAGAATPHARANRIASASLLAASLLLAFAARRLPPSRRTAGVLLATGGIALILLLSGSLSR